MNPRTPGKSGGHPRRRLLALALLLVLSLTLGGGLAFQAIQTARRHRETAERALEDYASFAAFILASQSFRQLGGAVVETFANWPAAGGPSTVAVPKGTVCPAGLTSFEQPPGRPLHVRGKSLTSSDLAFLVDTLTHAMDLLEEVGWRFRFIRAPSTNLDGYFVMSYKVASDTYGLRGFSTCFGSQEAPFRQVMLAERALPPALTGDLQPDSLFSVTVTAGQGALLYQSPVTYASPYHGTARLGTEFGDLSLKLELRPEIAGRLVIGGIPSSPTPLAVGLLGLSTLLVVTALFQLKREYELIAIRSDFVSNVSHELRTPLSQILIFTDLLRLGRLKSPADRERSLDIIDQEARRLIRLVENVLQFSRSSVARRPLERETLPLAAVVHDTLEAFRPLAHARDVILRADISPVTSVRADPSALRQILLNLLDNAVKYGPRGQTVSVAAEILNGRTRVTVEDQGPGIPLEDRERVWEGYFRLQREAHSAVAGSGIGLSVVRSLVTGMGGKAWIEDADTGGARFVVELASGEAGSNGRNGDHTPGGTS